MLFAYKHLPDHSIYKLQEWVDRIFLDVWCKADPAIEYDIDLLPEEIKEVVIDIYNDDRIRTDYLYGPIERVYKIFQTFDMQTKNKMTKYYTDNNSIETLCKNTCSCNPVLYTDIDTVNSQLRQELENFFKNLYDSVIDLSAVQKRIGTIGKYYKDFMKYNKPGVCPVCGLAPIDSEYSNTREEYDHYLPKSKYPFNSINFTNLVPVCHKCNSSNKNANDPLHTKDGKRRKAFFLYSREPHHVDITISISRNDMRELRPEDFEIEFNPESLREEIQTWDELYNVKIRYIATCIDNASYWRTQVFDEYENVQISRNENWENIIVNAIRNPYKENNFLKRPFLEACATKGIS